jgi:ACS family hexuronate transporter-like MFS transporter
MYLGVRRAVPGMPWWRWWMPTAAMLLLSLLSYVDRNVLALLSPTILRETGLTVTQYGWMISAFSAAYLIGNPFWGRTLDRYGVRVGLACSVALWTAASVSHAYAYGILAFVLARFALGFGEGATFPGGLRTATLSLRQDQRARGVALAYSGGSLGAVITPLVVTPIALAYGWRGAFVVTGVFGIAWLLVWAFVSRDERLAHVRPGPDAPRDAPAPAVPRLTDPSIIGFMLAYAFGGLPLGFVLYGAPIHLGRGLGCDQATLGHVLWLPPLGWEVGYFFWGWIVDRAAAQGRVGPGFFKRLFPWLAVAGAPLVAAGFVRSLPAVLALLFLGMFVSAGFVIASLAEVIHRHSTAHGAYLAGLGAGSWSGLMTLAMLVFAPLLDRKAYTVAYALAAGSFAVAWLGWALASRRVRGEGAPLPRSSA